MNTSKKTQHDRFKGAARQLETDVDEARFNETLGKLLKQTPDQQGE